MLSPILEKFTTDDSDVKSGSGRALDLVTVDTDTEMGLAQAYEVAPFLFISALPISDPIS
jgi:thioredoxin 1